MVHRLSATYKRSVWLFVSSILTAILWYVDPCALCIVIASASIIGNWALLITKLCTFLIWPREEDWSTVITWYSIGVQKLFSGAFLKGLLESGIPSRIYKSRDLLLASFPIADELNLNQIRSTFGILSHWALVLSITFSRTPILPFTNPSQVSIFRVIIYLIPTFKLIEFCKSWGLFFWSILP